MLENAMDDATLKQYLTDGGSTFFATQTVL